MKDQDLLALNLKGWPLPDEYLVEIGRISAVWAALESFLNICLGKLAGFNELTDPKPFILITHASFPQRLDMLGALCEQLVMEHPKLSNYKQVIASLKSAQALRNRFAHHALHYDAEMQRAIMAVGSARGSLKMSTQTVGLADLRRAIVAIDEAQTMLFNLIMPEKIDPLWKRRAQQNSQAGGPAPDGRTS